MILLGENVPTFVVLSTKSWQLLPESFFYAHVNTWKKLAVLARLIVYLEI